MPTVQFAFGTFRAHVLHERLPNTDELTRDFQRVFPEGGVSVNASRDESTVTGVTPGCAVENAYKLALMLRESGFEAEVV
jgi:hypothetical protein